MDDYEEGTFTVGFTGASITPDNTAASYTKIGRIVNWSYYTLTATIASASGNAFLTGLPFTVKNSDSSYSAVAIAHNTFFGGSATVGQQGYHNKNATSVSFNAIGNFNNVSFTNGSGKYLIISGTYETDA